MSLLPALLGTKASYFLIHSALIALPRNAHVLMGYSYSCSKDVELIHAAEELSKKYEIREPVALFQGKFHFMARSSSASLFPCFRRAIYLDSGLLEIDREAALWHLRHQFCLLSNEDHRVSSVVFGVSAIAWYILFSLPLAFAGSIASFYGLKRLMKLGLNRSAERDALASCTKSELEGAIRFFTASSLARRQLTLLVSPFKELQVKLKREGGDSRLKEAKIALTKRFGVSKEAIIATLQDSRVDNLRRHILFRILEDLDDEICSL
jgi:hypothetical protein